MSGLAAWPPGAPVVPVSVVIPCFRCSGTIRRALRSVLVQTALPEEIVLVDDASGDGSLAELEAVAREIGGGRVRIVALPRNAGAGEARNAGWDAARAAYVAFLDADDAWHPRKLELQWGYMQAHPEVDVTGHLSRQVAELPAEEPVVAIVSAAPISAGMLLLSNRFVTPSAMLRRALSARFEAGRRHMEDHLLWLQLVFAGARVERIPRVLCYTFKPAFGHGGLSAALWRMEKGELANYRSLYRNGHIGALTAGGLHAWSLMKFVRRIAIVGARRLAGQS